MGPAFSCVSEYNPFDGCKYRDKIWFFANDFEEKILFSLDVNKFEP